MKIAIMQPYLFPYIGYFQLIRAVDKFVLLDDVNFINKGWINRNRILVQGKAHLFTVPLNDASQNKKIRELAVSDTNKWQDKLLRTLDCNYKKAPFFSEVMGLVQESIVIDETNISKIIVNSLKIINHYLGLATPIVESASEYNNQHLKGALRLIDICKQENADEYINPIGGVNLYSKEIFLDSKINLYFLQPELFFYRQFSDDFIPWLSIIDILMFNSAQQSREFMLCYKLI